MTKRKLFAKFFKYGFRIAVLCLLYGFFIEPKTLAVRHVTIISDNWQGAPLKIGLIADIHVGGWHVDAKRAGRIAAKLNNLSPDIVLLAGDYVNGHIAHEKKTVQFNLEIENGIRNLGNISAPLGVHAVLGNHDAWYGERRIRTLLDKANITVLNNQNKIIEAGNAKFCLIGLADAFTGMPDKMAFSDCPAGYDIISFMHSPDSFSLLPSSTDLALAGHTHGGQINIPFIGRRVTSTKAGRKYAYGLIDLGRFPAFVTSGIGTSILPARFRARPEIVLITLRSP